MALIEVKVPQLSESVSEATLKAWWAMCLTMKSADQWTGDEMQAFFDRCFPDKLLSRDRRRGLREPPPSGPKRRAAE